MSFEPDDTLNRFLVGTAGKKVAIVALHTEMERDAALNLAAYLIQQVESLDLFEEDALDIEKARFRVTKLVEKIWET